MKPRPAGGGTKASHMAIWILTTQFETVAPAGKLQALLFFSKLMAKSRVPSGNRAELVVEARLSSRRDSGEAPIGRLAAKTEDRDAGDACNMSIAKSYCRNTVVEKS